MGTFDGLLEVHFLGAEQCTDTTISIILETVHKYHLTPKNLNLGHVNPQHNFGTNEEAGTLMTKNKGITSTVLYKPIVLKSGNLPLIENLTGFRDIFFLSEKFDILPISFY
ncbi:hypothetical protein CDAR_446731 [Caerostris darwini]|uniref:Uncharacterized protein n=1 Tax=Caerostris darwini TaxID=1538125 RepID=A0AAV4WZ91_9ARAC|nr:hypothetical protein CDAR_446731 [Caerostris darwini]